MTKKQREVILKALDVAGLHYTEQAEDYAVQHHDALARFAADLAREALEVRALVESYAI